MKLFEDFYDARQAMESAHQIMASDEKTEKEKLDAMLLAFAAERSIELLDQKDGVNYTDPDPEFWQRRYEVVKAFRDAYNEASRRANEASRRAFLASMESSFDELPGDLKKSMNASFNPVHGWSFITEY
jgi:hypothetical protein